MKQKKITIIMSYDYEEMFTASNVKIASRIKRELLRNLEPRHEKIESVIVEDIQGDKI